MSKFTKIFYIIALFVFFLVVTGCGNGSESRDIKDTFDVFEQKAHLEVSEEFIEETFSDGHFDEFIKSETDNFDANSNTITITQIPNEEIVDRSVFIKPADENSKEKTVSLAIFVKNPGEISGIAFNLFYDKGFLKPLSFETYSPFSEGNFHVAKAGKFILSRGVFSYGCVILREKSDPMSDYFATTKLTLPDQDVKGSKRLALLTFRILKSGKSKLDWAEGKITIRDSSFAPVKIKTYGVKIESK